MTDFLNDPVKWRAIREKKEYEPLRALLFKEYDEYCRDKDIPVLKFSDEMEYFKNGVRSSFEKPYFLRRHQLAVYGVLSLIYPEREDYFINLCDVAAAICDEYSWQVPAHRPSENRNKNDGHSLFAAETGLCLSEIKRIFKERMDPCLIARITDAIDRKILTSFEGRITAVEQKNITNNWASVCAGSIGLTFLYESPERFSKIRPRIEKCMENYLKGVSEDGGTPEGADYWNYGYGFYMLYYATLKELSGEKEAGGLYSEKAKKLAGFFSGMLLSGNCTVSFADASCDAECNIWLAYFLNKEYKAQLPPPQRLILNTEKFSTAVRAFIYYDPSRAGAGLAGGEYYYDKLEWYIKRGKNYSFAAKGGKNDIEDNHNHNDIGSFIVVHNGRQVLCDLGSPQYTASNFGATRYEGINNSSLGHSVPLINKKAQYAGEGAFGKLTVGEKIKIDLKNAYEEKPEKLERTFELKENELILKDEFMSGTEITERFVTDIKPEIKEKYVAIEETGLEIPEGWSVSVTSAETTFHSGKKRDIFLIDFIPVCRADSFKTGISFDQGGDLYV